MIKTNYKFLENFDSGYQSILLKEISDSVDKKLEINYLQEKWNSLYDIVKYNFMNGVTPTMFPKWDYISEQVLEKLLDTYLSLNVGSRKEKMIEAVGQVDSLIIGFSSSFFDGEYNLTIDDVLNNY